MGAPGDPAPTRGSPLVQDLEVRAERALRAADQHAERGNRQEALRLYAYGTGLILALEWTGYR